MAQHDLVFLFQLLRLITQAIDQGIHNRFTRKDVERAFLDGTVFQLLETDEFFRERLKSFSPDVRSRLNYLFEQAHGGYVGDADVPITNDGLCLLIWAGVEIAEKFDI